MLLSYRKATGDRDELNDPIDNIVIIVHKRKRIVAVRGRQDTVWWGDTVHYDGAWDGQCRTVAEIVGML